MDAVSFVCLLIIGALSLLDLFTAHLKCLQGFYASDIYLVAEDQEQALQKALGTIREYIQTCAEAFYYMGFIDAYPEDTDWEENLGVFFGKVEAELREKLAPVPSGTIINIRS